MKIGDNIILSNKIGTGAFGSVYVGKDTFTNKLYAVKKVSKSLLVDNSTKIYFNNEIYLIKHLPPHPNIIKFHSLHETISSYYVVTDYCNGGSLESSLIKYYELHSKPFPESLVRSIAKQILNAIQFLHSNNIIHRDIKAENILLSYSSEQDLINFNIQNAQVKLIDFGFARLLEKDQTASSIIGTPLFMDPKILNQTIANHYFSHLKTTCQYNRKVDIWSFGIVVYQMLMGIVPFNGVNCNELLMNVRKRKFSLPDNINNFTLSKECIAFIDRVLNIDMNLRPNADELMNDNWITGKYDIKETAILKGKDEFVQGKHYFFFKDYWKDKTKHRKCLSMVKVQNNLNRQRRIESFLEKMKHVQSSNRSNNNKHVECSNNVFKEKKVYVRKETFSKVSNTVRRLLSLSISNFDKDTKGSDDIENDISSCHTPIKAENHHVDYHI